MSPHNSGIWPVVLEERQALIHDLEMLPAHLWRTPSLCPGWNVHDVLAHLVDTAKTNRMSFLRNLAAARFNFDRANASGVERERAENPTRTLASFRAVLARTTGPPAPLPTRLVEAFVHGEDIRRVVGINHEYPTAQVVTALSYQLKTTVQIGGGKELGKGFRLIASDAEFQRGTGPEVYGPALAILLSVSGRPVGANELGGPGVTAFTKGHGA